MVYRAGKLPKELPAWFAQPDEDKDGQVGLYEWKKAGRSIPEFEAMDLNGDGFITVEEALRYAKMKAKNVASAAPTPGARFGGAPSFGGPETPSFGGPGAPSFGGPGAPSFGGSPGMSGPPGSGGGPPSFGRSRGGPPSFNGGPPSDGQQGGQSGYRRRRRQSESASSLQPRLLLAGVFSSTDQHSFSCGPMKGTHRLMRSPIGSRLNGQIFYLSSFILKLNSPSPARFDKPLSAT